MEADKVRNNTRFILILLKSWISFRLLQVETVIMRVYTRSLGFHKTTREYPSKFSYKICEDR